ncbi:MAG: phosphoribosyl-AMP cyclohydrolase [Micavibrio sp.]|nr:phosphoribosyl-AMP cyclohydrolase [Micavibrio sp.]
MKSSDETLEFKAKYDDRGFIPCITTSAKTGHVLMFAYMNEAALQKTIETGEVHYWSRSKGRLWHKGESSGMVQKVIEIRTDCDQDCLLISVDMEPEASCHTGRRSCFYRKLKRDGGLEFVDSGRIFDPEDVY